MRQDQKKRVPAARAAIRSLVIIGGVAACTAVAQAKTTVKYWNFFTGGDGIRMQAMVKKFNDTHKNIKIDATTLQWGTPFYTKVRTSAAIGQGPDLMTYHLSHLKAGVANHVLRPYTMQELHSVGLKAGDYRPLAWKAAHLDGKLYAVPLDMHSIILYYNKDLLKKAGMLGPDGLPKGLDGIKNFDAALAKLTRLDGSAGLSIASNNGPQLWRIFYTMLMQQNGSFLSQHKVLPGGNVAKAETAVDAVAKWIKEGWAPRQTSYQASLGLFTSGKAALMIHGDWAVPTLVDLSKAHKLGFKWGAIQIPTWYARKTTWCDSHSFTIPDRKGNPVPPKEVKADLTVIAWMNRHSIMWASGGHVPAFLPVTNSKAFKQMEPNATYSSFAQTCSYDPRSTITGVASPTYDAASNDLVPSINGQISAKRAVKLMQRDLDNDMK